MGYGTVHHGDLPEPRIHIKSQVLGGPRKAFQCLTNARQWMRVLDNQRVKLSEVNIEAE